MSLLLEKWARLSGDLSDKLTLAYLDCLAALSELLADSDRSNARFGLHSDRYPRIHLSPFSIRTALVMAEMDSHVSYPRGKKCWGLTSLS